MEGWQPGGWPRIGWVRGHWWHGGRIWGGVEIHFFVDIPDNKHNMFDIKICVKKFRSHQLYVSLLQLAKVVCHFYRTQVSLGSDLWVRLSLTEWVSELPFANSTDVTLPDGDTKPILTDNANRAIQGNVAMHVTHQVNLVVKFLTKVVPSGGKIWN